MVETLAIVTICKAFLKWCTKTIQNIWDLPGSSPGTFFQAKPWILIQWIDPTRFWIQMVFYGVMLWDVVTFLKGMAIHPQLVETQKLSAWCSHLEPLVPGPRRSVPNGSTQRFTWSTQWLHLSQRLLSTFCKETISLLLPSNSVFFLVVEVFHHKRPNLEPYKDWKRISKQRQAGNTRGRHPNTGGWKLTEVTPEPKASWK